MLLVSSKKDNLIGITDEEDNTEEYFTEEYILKALRVGIKIYGSEVSNGVLYTKVVQKGYTAIEMAKRLLVDSIWKSANLEGLGTTFPKTEAILENAPTNTTREEMYFIVNMKRAWYFLFDNIEYPCNLMFLRELNKIVGEGLFNGNGSVRNSPVRIGGTDWIPDIPIEEIIVDRLHDIERVSDIEERALKYFCYVARSQIFIDGNKRVAQLIANKVLIDNNIGIFQIPIEKLEEFKGLLIKFYETNNDVKIIEFMKSNCIVRV